MALWKKLGQFTARDSNDDEYTILIYQEYFDSSELSADLTPTGRVNLRTENDDMVSHLTKGMYRIFTRHRMIDVTSDDPNAP